MTDDLAEWLLEQIEHDEAVAKEQGETHTLACIARANYEWDHQCRCGFASRVLAECDAKRRIVAMHTPDADHIDCPTCTDPEARMLRGGHEHLGLFWCQTARLLALPYADRPGYREEWRPMTPTEGTPAA